MCASANERHHTHPTPPRPHMHETARTVSEMDINTSFTLGSTSEKMRADEGSEGTTTTTTTTVHGIGMTGKNTCIC